MNNLDEYLDMFKLALEVIFEVMCNIIMRNF
jgi:hypothetical protein